MLGALSLQLLCSPPYLRRNKIGLYCIMLPLSSTTWLEKYATLVTVTFLSNVHEQAMATQKIFFSSLIAVTGARHVNVVVDREHKHTYVLYVQYCF